MKTKKHTHSIKGSLTLKNFKKGSKGCYNRKTRPQLSVVDSHLHLRPFGGPPIPFKQMLNILRNSGVLFAEAEGIGQHLPINSSCSYYLDCPHVNVIPSIKNDIANAQAVLDNDMDGVSLNLSMTFPDLAKPATILPQMKMLEKEFPGMFRWMGEVNLVKQALFNNGHKPVSIKAIKKWKPFMKELYKKGFPISIHSDLGNDTEHFKYLPLIEEVLRLYPNNIIVWMHLGLSKQLKTLSPEKHVELLDKILSENPNLYFDISWSVLYNQEFKDPKKRLPYVELLNKWPKRFLPGTDFISAIKNNEKDYKKELKLTSSIFKDVNDDAFRRIALGQNYFDISKSKYVAPSIC
jgi:hypothetical protein